MSTEIDLPDKVLAIAKKLAKLEPSKKHFFSKQVLMTGSLKIIQLNLSP